MQGAQLLSDRTRERIHTIGQKTGAGVWVAELQKLIHVELDYLTTKRGAVEQRISETNTLANAIRAPSGDSDVSVISEDRIRKLRQDFAQANAGSLRVSTEDRILAVRDASGEARVAPEFLNPQVAQRLFSTDANFPARELDGIQNSWAAPLYGVSPDDPHRNLRVNMLLDKLVPADERARVPPAAIDNFVRDFVYAPAAIDNFVRDFVYAPDVLEASKLMEQLSDAAHRQFIDADSGAPRAELIAQYQAQIESRQQALIDIKKALETAPPQPEQDALNARFTKLTQEIDGLHKQVAGQENESLLAERAKLFVMLGQLKDRMLESVKKREELKSEIERARNAAPIRDQDVRTVQEKRVAELEAQVNLHDKAETLLKSQFEYRLRELESNIDQRPEGMWEQFSQRFQRHLEDLPFIGNILGGNSDYRFSHLRDDIYRDWQYAKIGFSRGEALSIANSERQRIGFVPYMLKSISNLYEMVQRNPSLARQHQREIMRAVDWWTTASPDPTVSGGGVTTDTINALRTSLARDIVFDGLTQGFVARRDDPKPEDRSTLAFLQVLADTGTASVLIGDVLTDGLIGGAVKAATRKLQNAAVDAALDMIPQQKKQVADAVLHYLASGDASETWQRYKSGEQLHAAGEAINLVVAPKSYLATRAQEVKKLFDLATNSDTYKLSKAESVFRKITAFALPVAGAGLIVASFFVPGLGVIGLPVLLALGAAGLFGPIWGHIMAGRVFSGTENYDKELEKQKRGEELRMHEQMGIDDPLRAPKAAKRVAEDTPARLQQAQQFIAEESPKLQQQVLEPLAGHESELRMLQIKPEEVRQQLAELIPQQLGAILDSEDMANKVAQLKTQQKQAEQGQIEQQLMDPAVRLTAEQMAIVADKTD